MRQNGDGDQARLHERSEYNPAGSRLTILAHHFLKMKIWGFSSAGRAPALQAGGQRFDPANLHHILKEIDWSTLEEMLHWVSCEIQTAPWKLNIVIMKCNYEKATVKENF